LRGKERETGERKTEHKGFKRDEKRQGKPLDLKWDFSCPHDGTNSLSKKTPAGKKFSSQPCSKMGKGENNERGARITQPSARETLKTEFNVFL
jgi:hypothetical protein